MSASTENAPVYNVIQQEIQMTQENFQLWKSQSTKSTPQMMEGNQQSNKSSTDCNYEEAMSTHNTMSISLQKYLNVQQKHLCMKPLRQLNFPSKSCFQ